MPRDISIIANSVVSSTSMSGGDRIFIELCRRWREEGFKVHLLVCEAGYHLCRRNGLEGHYLIISRFNVKKFGVIISYLLRILCSLISIFRLQNRHIIYSSSDFLTDTVPAYMMKTRNRGSRWVAGLYLRALNPFKRDTRLTLQSVLYYVSQKLSLLLMKQQAELVFVLNDDDRRYVEQEGIDPNRVKVIGGGVDFEFISHITAEQEGLYDACFVGRFHPQKGLFDLIKIWKNVCYKRKDAKLAIIGWGASEWFTNLTNDIRSAGLENNIDLLGFLDGYEKFRILKSSRVFVFPSLYESWGIVACEAMACGLPVVAYDLPIFRKNFPLGMKTVPIRDTKAFASTVLELLEDVSLRNKLKMDALRMASAYDWDTVADQTLQYLEKINAP